MLENSEIRSRAWSSLTGKWGICAIIVLVYSLLVMGLSVIPFLGSIGSIIISGPLSLGMAIIFLRVVRDESIDVSLLFKGFDDFMRSFVAGLLVAFYTSLWLLLLIVPGIIAGLSYSLTFFIISEDPSIAPNAAITQSKAMMQGHKMELFLLQLSFIGWFLLGIITMGIAFLWIGSYYYTAMTVFYLEVKGESSIPEEEYVPLSSL